MEHDHRLLISSTLDIRSLSIFPWPKYQRIRQTACTSVLQLRSACISNSSLTLFLLNRIKGEIVCLDISSSSSLLLPLPREKSKKRQRDTTSFTLFTDQHTGILQLSICTRTLFVFRVWFISIASYQWWNSSPPEHPHSPSPKPIPDVRYRCNDLPSTRWVTTVYPGSTRWEGRKQNGRER